MKQLFNNKKGLASSLLVLTIVLFVMGIISLFSLYIWGHYMDAINGMDADIAPDHVKTEIAEAGAKIFIFDKLFVTLYIALLIGFIISASTLPSTDVLSVFVYIMFLIAITVVAMLLTNTMDVITGETVLSTVTSQTPIMLNIIKFLPYSTFFVGLLGAIIFYSRQNGQGGGNIEQGFE